MKTINQVCTETYANQGSKTLQPRKNKFNKNSGHSHQKNNSPHPETNIVTSRNKLPNKQLKYQRSPEQTIEKLYALVGAFSANLTADCFECRISICLSCTWANLATAFTVNHQCLHEKDHCLHSVRFMKMHTVLMRTLRVLKLYLKGRPLQSLCKRLGVFFQRFLNFFQVVFICAVVVCHTRWPVNT